MMKLGVLISFFLVLNDLSAQEIFKKGHDFYLGESRIEKSVLHMVLNSYEPSAIELRYSKRYRKRQLGYAIMGGVTLAGGIPMIILGFKDNQDINVGYTAVGLGLSLTGLCSSVISMQYRSWHHRAFKRAVCAYNLREEISYSPRDLPYFELSTKAGRLALAYHF
jgi:hypothetical protein